MASMIDFAKKELDLLVEDENDTIQKEINKMIMELVEVFENQGHGNVSAFYVIDKVSRLLKFKPIKPLTGEDDEWFEYREGSFQNKRCPLIFKDDDGVYNMDGRIFSRDGGETWFTNHESRVYDEPEKVYLGGTENA